MCYLSQGVKCDLRDMGHGTRDMGHGTWDMGHGTLYVLCTSGYKM